MNNLYKYKDLKLGIIILCPNLNIGHLKNTITSANIHYPNSKVVVIFPENCTEDDLKIVPKNNCAYKAGCTTSSLINCGFKNAPCDEWNFFIFSKGWLKSRIDIKYSYFIEGKNDILFPATSQKKFGFVEENISLFLAHKSAFKIIGAFPDIEDIETSKLIWATKAMENKYKFKGIVGGRAF